MALDSLHCDSLFHRETVLGKERVQVLIGVSIRLSDGQIVMTSNGVVIWGSIVNSKWGY